MARAKHPTLFALTLFACLCATAPAGVAAPADPLNSVMWDELSERFFGSAQVVFDEKVRVTVPSTIENQTQVPVTADARALEGVKKLIVFADLNPIVHVLTFHPDKAQPVLSFRMKVEQGTPIRAAALTADGVWHVGGVFADAAGGGCTAPAAVRGLADWSDTVGQAQAKVWRGIDGSARLRLRVRHPMDTGLAEDHTPAFFIETLRLNDQLGNSLASIEMFEPVSEDPTLTMHLRLPQSSIAVQVESRDNNGNIYKALVPAGSPGG